MNTQISTYFSDIPVSIRELQQAGSPPQRLLLQVEDNQANAELIKQIISRRDDLKLLTATDGNQGIEMASSHRPDVILMDMKMLGINGYEAFVRLRNNPATAHIPVIALSSNAHKNEIKQCLDAGFFQYLTKPFKITELMAVIDAALDYGKASHQEK
jgi:CheY-like chemotaxis protein